MQPGSMHAEFRRQLAELTPDSFVVVAYGALIPASVLKLSKPPAINMHPSLLPDLRGPSPIQTALLLGYTHTGVSMMQLDEALDHGPILAQEKIAIAPDDTYVSLSEKLSHLAKDVLVHNLPPYLKGDLMPTQQDHSLATYTKAIRSVDGLLDLRKDAKELHNAIRALNPWPGTYIVWRGERLRVLSAVPLSRSISSKPFYTSKGGLLCIRCGKGALEVITVQLASGKPMRSDDFLNGHPDILT